MRKNTYQKKLLIWTLFKQCDVDHIQCTQQTFISMKTSFLFVFRRGLQGVLKTSWSRRIYSSWSYILKTPSRRFQDLLKTSSRRLAKMSSKHLQDVLKDVFNSFLRLTGKMVIYTKLCLGDTSEKFMVRVQYFQ